MDSYRFLSPPLECTCHPLLTVFRPHLSPTYFEVQLDFFLFFELFLLRPGDLSFFSFFFFVAGAVLASRLVLVSCHHFHLKLHTPSPWLGCSIFHMVYMSQQISGFHRMGSSVRWKLSFHLKILASASLLGVTDIYLKAMSTTWHNALILFLLVVFQSQFER